MKTIKGALGSLAVITTLAMSLASVSHAQSPLQFTGVKATVENAILLYWASNTNEVYEIDYADQLAGNPDGTTAWLPLYTDYPSQGTNSFVADCGNYDMAPEIPHPKYSPIRFYRAVYTGTNTSPINPTVAITSPAIGASLSGDIVVSVSSASPELLTEVTLYVDGEPQFMSYDGTNFLVNTCEWPNGPHTLFAVAKSQSTIEGPTYDSSVTFGNSVSSYVNVNFSNLITRLDLSEHFFEPSEGQTQKVTAAFAANVNWTLQIQDANSNAVRTVTGSGSSMLFNWDGTGDGGVAIGDGAYTYLLTAQSNEQALQSQISGGDGSGSGGPPSLSLASASVADYSTELFATPSDGSGSAVPLFLYPPQFDTNRLTIFEASWSEMMAPRTSLLSASTMDSSTDGAVPMYSGASSQSTRGPKRKPRIGVKNKSGTFGVSYKTYRDPCFIQQPRTGNPIPSLAFTGTDGGGRSSGYIHFSTKRVAATYISKGFAEGMQIGKYKPKFILADEQWSPNDIRSFAGGGNSIFSTCNFGLLIVHGVYGTFPEIDGVKYTYLALDDRVNHGSYLRLSDMAFGSPGPAGMKWMTLFSCNTLYGPSVTSMANNSKLPDNGNLHLLLGFNSVYYTSPLLGIMYASNLVAEVPIPDSLVNACKQVYTTDYKVPAVAAIFTKPVTVRAMGYNSCFGDTIYQSNDPDPNSGYQIQDYPIDFTQ